VGAALLVVVVCVVEGIVRRRAPRRRVRGHPAGEGSPDGEGPAGEGEHGEGAAPGDRAAAGEGADEAGGSPPVTVATPATTEGSPT
jgi:hypothetical protein